MRDHPIIFSAPMVQALLAGRKTQTRRLAFRYRATLGGPVYDSTGHQAAYIEPRMVGTPSSWQRVRPGDRLWVKENYARVGDNPDDIHACPDLRVHAYYAADSVQPKCLRWRPSIHMPRWASRLTLHVEAVRVERLQEISEADARAEGVSLPEHHTSHRAPHKQSFAALWEVLHGPGAWDANPEVVVIGFRVEQRNIDA